MPPRPAELPADLPAGLAAALAEGRAGGAAEADPVGWHALESLARRAALHQGAARAFIERRLAERLAAWQARDAAAPAETPTAQGGRAIAALRALGGPTPRAGGAAATDPSAAAPELKALRDFRQRWQRLQAEHWLDQSLASAPGNAGPLNSHALAVRTLAQLNALSPGYVAHLLPQLDALRWLEPEAGEAAGARAGPLSARRARPAGGR